MELNIENLMANTPDKTSPSLFRQISKTTFEAYKGRLQKLQQMNGNQSIEWIMTHPKETVQELQKNISNFATLSSYVVPVCKMFHVHPFAVLKWQKSYATWHKYLKFFRKKEEEEVQKSKLSHKQKQNYVTWDEVVDVFCKFPTPLSLKEEMEYILFAVLLNIKPKRSDFGNVRIFKYKKECENCKDNCLWIDGGVLYIKKYKTVKKYGMIVETLSQKITDIIRHSLTRFPRDFLFVTSDGNGPYTNNNSYGKFVKRTFFKHFGRPMGVSLWRNVYIRANINFNETSYETIAETAKLLGHSVDQMFKTYRKIDMIPRPISQQGLSVEC